MSSYAHDMISRIGYSVNLVGHFKLQYHDVIFKSVIRWFRFTLYSDGCEWADIMPMINFLESVIL